MSICTPYARTAATSLTGRTTSIASPDRTARMCRRRVTCSMDDPGVSSRHRRHWEPSRTFPPAGSGLRRPGGWRQSMT
ncbi:hypothetical protein EVAR_58232_1 [Eumeta japonica]|uniref:Uncharacterized protein n=1 Tax=Eumeta variegata TaxID=151549 RepID=A0A4C2ACF1_EUMVA|nr:hypothetical protein EVAR_58232_1 [Eumeta japonica]